MAAQQLSHNEVWDDSALVDSWNEALEEYKKYHSIAAKGESLEDAIAAAERSEPQIPEVSATTTGDATLPAWETKVEEPKDETLEEGAGTTAMSVDKPSPVEQHSLTNGVSSAMPQAIMKTVQDEGLKNLMMSWYYAGYYTGLYEGQQKAHAQSYNQPNSKAG